MGARERFIGVCALLLVSSSCARVGVEGGRGSASDAAVDVPRVDGGRRDGAFDAAADGVASSDGTRDRSLGDLPAGPDALSLDAATGQACATGSTATLVYGPTMVLCTSTNLGANQCAAELTFCNQSGGWRLCTASEYRARGGTTKPSTVAAWIKSCIRHGSPIAPTDGLCSSCSEAAAPAADDTFPCGGTLGVITGSSHQHVGVRTAPSCHRVGLNDATQEALWQGTEAFVEGFGAVCCL